MGGGNIIIDGVRFQPGTNDIWEPGEPMVRASDGTPLSPDGAEAQAVMRTLGITSFQNVRLTPAAEYLRCRRQAIIDAHKVDYDNFGTSIDCARTFAGKAGIKFDTFEASIHKLYNWEVVNEIMFYAGRCAQEGNIDAAEERLRWAEEIATDVHFAFDISLAYKIVKLGLQNAIPLAFSKAREAASRGDIPGVEAAIAKAREYTQRLLLPFDEDEAARILREGLIKAAESIPKK